MLRDSLKSAFCGLVIAIIPLFLGTGCTSTRPLLAGVQGVGSGSFRNLKVKADPYVRYRFMGVLESLLPFYVRDFEGYHVNIEISEESNHAVYTEREAAKKEIRMIAKIEVFDKEFNLISRRSLDAFSTCEISDDMPFSSQASETQTRNLVINEIANSVAFAVSSIISK